MTWWIAGLCLGGLILGAASLLAYANWCLPDFYREENDDRESVYEDYGL